MKKIVKKKKSTFCHVKIGDFVKVICGQNKGKTGVVSKIQKKTSKVIINGMNMKKKHVKPKNKKESGRIEELEFPIHSSNLTKMET